MIFQGLGEMPIELFMLLLSVLRVSVYILQGLGEMPNDTPSARVRRSGQGSRSNSASRGSSAGSSVSDSIASNASSSARKRSGVRLDEQTQEEIKTMCVLMAASDWRDRYKGITTLVEMTEANPAVIGENIVKVCAEVFYCLFYCI